MERSGKMKSQNNNIFAFTPQPPSHIAPWPNTLHPQETLLMCFHWELLPFRSQENLTSFNRILELTQKLEYFLISLCQTSLMAPCDVVLWKWLRQKYQFSPFFFLSCLGSGPLKHLSWLELAWLYSICCVQCFKVLWISTLYSRAGCYSSISTWSFQSSNLIFVSDSDSDCCL